MFKKKYVNDAKLWQFWIFYKLRFNEYFPFLFENVKCIWMIILHNIYLSFDNKKVFCVESILQSLELENEIQLFNKMIVIYCLLFCCKQLFCIKITHYKS